MINLVRYGNVNDLDEILNICDKENILNCSTLLQNVKISCGNYKETIDFIIKKVYYKMNY